MEKRGTKQTDAFISSELWMLMIKIKLIFLKQLKQNKDDSEACTNFFFYIQCRLYGSDFPCKRVSLVSPKLGH